MVRFEVWDRNHVSADAMIGQGVITIQQIIASKGVMCPVSLTYKGKQTGQLNVQCKYHPDGGQQDSNQTQQQMQQP